MNSQGSLTLLGGTFLQPAWIEHLTLLPKTTSQSSWFFILDAPTGTALRLLKGNLQAVQSLVLTDNLSPEYLDDLWEFGVALLAVNVTDLTTLQLLFNQAFQGQRIRWSAPTSPLTPGERRLLHLLAHGSTNKQIAATLHLSERTVQNTLSRVFEKLGVAGRLEAGLRYWGLPLQENPPHLGGRNLP